MHFISRKELKQKCGTLLKDSFSRNSNCAEFSASTTTTTTTATACEMNKNNENSGKRKEKSVPKLENEKKVKSSNKRLKDVHKFLKLCMQADSAFAVHKFLQSRPNFFTQDDLVLTACSYGRLVPTKDNMYHMVAYSGCLLTLLELPIPGSSIDQPNKFGMRPLHFAAAKGFSLMLKTLLDLGAEPDVLADNEVSPLEVACRNHQWTCAIILVRAGSKLSNHQTSGSFTNTGRLHRRSPMCLAAAGGPAAVGALRTMLLFSTDEVLPKNIPTDDVVNLTPLMEAVIAKNRQAVLLILNWSMSRFYTSKSSNRATDLAHAAACIVDRSWNHPDLGAGTTPLHLAVYQDDVKMVNILLAAGANIFKCNCAGEQVFEVCHDESMLIVLMRFAKRWGVELREVPKTRMKNKKL